MTTNTKKTVKHLYKDENTLLVTTRVKVLLTFLVGIVLVMLTIYIVRQQYTTSLTQRVTSMAALLDAERVSSVQAGKQDASKDKTYLSHQLQQAQGVNSDARAIYLLSITDTNRVKLLVSSEPETLPGYVTASEALKAAFFSNKPLLEGPLRDDRGAKLSAVAPVYDTKGRQVAMVGMDIPVSTYVTSLALAAAVPVFGTLLAAVVFIATDTIRKRRQESVRMRSELVSIASHELRTPLTGIRWGEESLLGTELIKKNRETLQSMYDSTIRLQESIEDILQLANWQSGRSQKLLHTSTDISEMLAGIFATQKLPAAQKNITLEFASGWPKKLHIDCDAQRMKRVFNNLISNAIKYSTPGTSVLIAHQKVDGRHVITIKDHGIGIPKNEQEKVFAGFYRATNAVNHETGTGMGLYMSRNAIEQHGGKLWLTSIEGKGTTVFIQLP